ncbi:MAG: type VI secretion system tube protein Hcp [Bryobacterales bacterium]|nr:type VI secretion system tube protein Hcp [Bryobacterales bacterium]
MVNFVAKVMANGQHVQGESKEVGFDGWIEVLSYDWGGTRAGSTQGVGKWQGKGSYRALVLRKRVDAASPLLFKAFDLNEECDVILQLRKSGTGPKLENYMKIHIKGALISDLRQGNREFGGEVPEEEVAFTYREIEMAYDVQANTTGITFGGITHRSLILGRE